MTTEELVAIAQELRKNLAPKINGCHVREVPINWNLLPRQKLNDFENWFSKKLLQDAMNSSKLLNLANYPKLTTWELLMNELRYRWDQFRIALSRAIYPWDYD